MKIRCLKCNDMIESKDLHDCASCKCGACSIDGGNQYTRIGGDTKYINIKIKSFLIFKNTLNIIVMCCSL